MLVLVHSCHHVELAKLPCHRRCRGRALIETARFYLIVLPHGAIRNTATAELYTPEHTAAVQVRVIVGDFGVFRPRRCIRGGDGGGGGYSHGFKQAICTIMMYAPLCCSTAVVLGCPRRLGTYLVRSRPES